MTMIYIHQYSKPNGDGEYVIITEEKWGESEIADNCEPGYDHDGVTACEVIGLSIGTALPLDRALRTR